MLFSRLQVVVDTVDYGALSHYHLPQLFVKGGKPADGAYELSDFPLFIIHLDLFILPPTFNPLTLHGFLLLIGELYGAVDGATLVGLYLFEVVLLLTS